MGQMSAGPRLRSAICC